MPTYITRRPSVGTGRGRQNFEDVESGDPRNPAPEKDDETGWKAETWLDVGE